MTDFNDVKVFTGELMPKQDQSPAIMTEAAVQREIAEVQASIAIAKRFPRDQIQALDRITIACQRPGLAESALYSYARGGTEITGPSIRLAEAIAQQWGNLDFGIREIEQRHGESTVEAYAWDLETNTRQKKTFQVRHKRFTKKGSYDLTDPRDIYELVANQGARRLRACILGIIPGDVVESAQNQCEQTLKAKADISPEAVKKMVTAFENFQVTKEMIETRIQRKLESITAAQVIALRKIYNSLKDGMSKAADWFEITFTEEVEKPKEKKVKKEAPQAPPVQSQCEVNGNAQDNPKIVSPVTEDQLEQIAGLIHAKDCPYEIIIEQFGVSDLKELDFETGTKAIEWLAAK
jgi:hypothetical protein